MVKSQQNDAFPVANRRPGLIRRHVAREDLHQDAFVEQVPVEVLRFDPTLIDAVEFLRIDERRAE